MSPKCLRVINEHKPRRIQTSTHAPSAERLLGEVEQTLAQERKQRAVERMRQLAEQAEQANDGAAAGPELPREHSWYTVFGTSVLIAFHVWTCGCVVFCWFVCVCLRLFSAAAAHFMSPISMTISPHGRGGG